MKLQQTDESKLGWKDVLLIIAVIALLAATFMFQAAQAADPPSGRLSDVLDQAAKRFAQQDYAGARVEYERATKLDPGSIPAWRGLGWSLWQLGDHERALKVWRDLAKVQPNDADTLMALAQAQEFRENWQPALELYTRVLTLKPRRTAALFGRARVYQRLERPAAAGEDLQRAIALDPSSFDAQFLLAQNHKAMGRSEEALRIFNRLAAQRSTDPRYLRPMADLLLELDRPEEALRYYEQNLARDPGNRGTNLGLARAHAWLHRYRPAINQLERYLASHPDDTVVREELVRYAAALGDYATGEKHLNVLVRAHPGETRWRLALANTLRSSGKVFEGARIVRGVLHEEPQNVAALEFMLHVAMLAGNMEDVIQRLEQLAAADPGVKRTNRLGTAWIRLGEDHAANDRLAPAKAAYRKAAQAFKRSAQADPRDADALQGLATALRLSGDYPAAIAIGERVTATQPMVEWARRELYESSLAMRDYKRAERLLRESLERNPGSLRLRHELARTRFRKGDREAAIADLRALLDEAIQRGVPVLLYHGITEVAPADDSMPRHNFRDQMQALKRAGYEPIGIQQLLAFHRDGSPLPAKPVMITFDDARADSFRYADPVLEETGLHATMFVPVAEVGRHGEFNATWSTIAEMRRSGRWDIQCHSHAGHVPITVGADGRRGAFLANRMWLERELRLETRQEFAARLDADYRKCSEELLKALPGLKVAGYAYPFGEMGQKSLSNEPGAIEINTELVRKYYRIGFVQGPGSEVTRLSSATAMERFEVPWNFTGEDLLRHLRGIDAYTSTQLVLADLYSWDGRYAEARTILDEVGRSGEADEAALLARRGRVVMWQGDFAGARRDLLTAVELEEENRIARQGVEQLAQRTRPSLSVDGEASSDNSDRTSFSLGPVHKQYLGDRLALSTAYRYKRFADGSFDTGGAAGTVDLRTAGNELEVELAYRWNWRAVLAISGGMAQFEDDSPQPMFVEPEHVPLASMTLAVPLGDSIDLSLRGTKGYVGAAGAILGNVGAAGGEAQLQVRPWRSARFEGRYAHQRYDDGNIRGTGAVTLMQRLIRKPEIQVGYRFRYDDTREPSPYFYTPDRFIGNDAVVTLSVEAFGFATFSAEGSIGTGHERGDPARQQGSLMGTSRFEIADRVSIYLNGGRAQAADFRSAQAMAGIGVMF